MKVRIIDHVNHVRYKDIEVKNMEEAEEMLENNKDKLKKVLEICKINSDYDWDSNMENAPQDEFKAIVKIIEEK